MRSSHKSKRVSWLTCLLPITIQASEPVEVDKCLLLSKYESTGLRHRKGDIVSVPLITQKQDSYIKNICQDLVPEDRHNEISNLNNGEEILYNYDDLIEKGLSLPDEIIERSLNLLARNKGVYKRGSFFQKHAKDNINKMYVWAFILEKNIGNAHQGYSCAYLAYEYAMMWYTKLYRKLKVENEETGSVKVSQAVSRMVPLLCESLHTRTTQTTIKTAGK